MSGNAGPVERLKMKRKDGKPGTGTNRDGSQYEGTHVEVMAIWQNDRGKSATLAPDFAITYKGKPIADSYLNVFEGAARKSAQAADDGEDF